MIDGSLERDVGAERQLLAEATVLLDVDGEDYIAAVLEQLDRVEREIGNTGWLSHNVRELVDEMAEEGVDVSGWGVGVDYRLAMARMDPGIRAKLRIKLVRILTLAAVLWQETRSFAEDIDALDEQLASSPR